MLNKKHLILDAMGVVFVNEDDIEELLIPFLKERYYFNVDKLRELYYTQVSVGKISSHEFFGQLGIPDIERAYLNACLRIDTDFLKVARELGNRYTLSMVSNDVSEWSSYLRNKFNLGAIFSDFVISGDVGLRKPDIRIYDVFLERMNARADECIFIDNSLKNLEPASDLGMTTIYFRRSKSNYDFNPDFIVSNFIELRDLLLK